VEACRYGARRPHRRFERARGRAVRSSAGRRRSICCCAVTIKPRSARSGRAALGRARHRKSRILSDLRELLEARRADMRSSARPTMFKQRPLLAHHRNLERAVKARSDENPSRTRQARSADREHYGRPVTDVRFVASVLSIPFEERYGPSLCPPEAQGRDPARLADLAEAAARKQPSVILYEDVHWGIRPRRST